MFQVDELMDNTASAAACYSKAMILLSFILEEASDLSLSPPFSLTPDNKKRIRIYIDKLQSHQSQFLKSQPPSKLFPDANTK